MENHNVKKCYNSFSCILSVLIIAFVLGSVIFDLVVSKPETRRSINEIKMDVQEINKKIDIQSTYFMDKDSVISAENLDK